MAEIAEAECISMVDTRWIFRQIVDLQVAYLRDTDGRPLGEQRVATAGLYEVETELVQCPYHGSRYHHAKPMNVSALRPVTVHWEDIKAGFVQVHRAYGERVAADPLTIFDLWRIVNTGILLPAYAALRANDPVRDREVPAWLSSIYKVLIGIHSPVAHLMVEKLLKGGPPEPLPSAEVFLEHVETNRSLIGKEQVCAAPPALILRALSVILQGDSDEPIDTAPFHRTLGSPDGVIEFAFRTIDLLLLHFIFVARMRHSVSRLATRIKEAAAEGAPEPLADELLSRLQLLAKEQFGRAASFCKDIEEIQSSIDMGVLASALESQIGQTLMSAEPVEPCSDPVESGAQGPLAKLVQEEWASYKALENTYLANASEFSRSIAVTLGYAAGSEEVQHQDLVQVSGKTLGDLLQEISVELPCS